MTDEVTQSKQQAMLDQYQLLYDDYVTNLSSAQFQKASESQKALDALESDIYENTLLMPASENSGYLDLKSRMERVPTAEAQEDHTNAQMNASKFQYYALSIIAAVTALAAIRIISSSSVPSMREVAVVSCMLAISLWMSLGQLVTNW